MERKDRSYFEDRAEAELAAARAADHPDAAKAHYLLAGFYLNLVHNGEAPHAPVLNEFLSSPEAPA